MFGRLIKTDIHHPDTEQQEEDQDDHRVVPHDSHARGRPRSATRRHRHRTRPRSVTRRIVFQRSPQRHQERPFPKPYSPIDEPFNSKSYYPPSQLLCEAIFGYIMTQVATNAEFANTLMQLSANASLKKHRRKAEEALLAEFAQLEDLNVYEPFLDPNKLNRAQNNQALRAISLIKESATDGSRDEW